MARPHVWLTGDTDDTSFAPAVEWLRAECGPLAPRADDVAAIVVFLARPGRLGQPAIEQLQRQAPRARLVVVAGPWCEGELRSGRAGSRPWEGVTRIYWHQWQARLPHALADLGLRRRKLTEAEALLRTLKPPLRKASRRGLVVIATHSRESFDALADACGVGGLRAVWGRAALPPAGGADLLLIDGWRALSSPSIGPASVLLLDWPRQEDVVRAAERGISRVLAKPLLVTDLLVTLDAATGLARVRAA